MRSVGLVAAVIGLQTTPIVGHRLAIEHRARQVTAPWHVSAPFTEETVVRQRFRIHVVYLDTQSPASSQSTPSAMDRRSLPGLTVVERRRKSRRRRRRGALSQRASFGVLTTRFSCVSLQMDLDAPCSPTPLAAVTTGRPSL